VVSAVTPELPPLPPAYIPPVFLSDLSVKDEDPSLKALFM
jgi:hypothetical protein